MLLHERACFIQCIKQGETLPNKRLFKHLSLLFNKINKLDITDARMLDYIYIFDTKTTLQSRLYSVPYIYAML